MTFDKMTDDNSRRSFWKVNEVIRFVSNENRERNTKNYVKQKSFPSKVILISNKLQVKFVYQNQVFMTDPYKYTLL